MNKPKGIRLDLIKVIFLKIVNAALKLSNSVVVVLVIGIEGRGEFFKLSQLGGILAFFLCLSLGDFFIYNVKKEIENLKTFYTYSLFLIFTLGFICLIITFLNYETASFFLLFTLSGALEYLTLSFLKSKRKYNTVSLYLTLKIAAFIAIIYTFKFNFNEVVITYFVCSFFTYLIFSIILFDRRIFKGTKINYSGIIDYSKNIHLNNIFTDLENKSDIIILTIFLGNDLIGIYSIVVVLAQIINHLTHIIIQTIAPVFRSLNTKKIILLFNLLFIVSVVFSITLITTQKFLLSILYNLESTTAYITLTILCVAIIPETLNRLILTFYKYGNANKEFISKVAMVTAVINIVLNILLVPIWGIKGAAVVSLITYLTRFIIIYPNLNKELYPEKIILYNPAKTFHGILSVFKK